MRVSGEQPVASFDAVSIWLTRVNLDTARELETHLVATTQIAYQILCVARDSFLRDRATLLR